ncbi:ATP-binding protein [Luteimonas fraxinea]|uniref:ATP-binding protein n=1 Tax=Luteimonas fraxinea TaxID=2901869 RepID=UPI001E30071E|nr:ATP-binding protein [Luteimonas fraxinea]MCD9127678.1 ATP-binding protein [Luteimonas fraxinea]
MTADPKADPAGPDHGAKDAVVSPPLLFSTTGLPSAQAGLDLSTHHHPLLDLFRPTVATPAIERLCDAILSALDAGYRGMGVYGFARFGKTEATCYIRDRKHWLEPRSAAITAIDAPDNRKRSDASCFQWLLATLGVRMPARATTDQLCTLVMGRLIELSRNADTRLIMLFIDEAQRLLPSDYEHLVTLDNRLTRERFYLFAVFVHQRDITGFSNEVITSLEHPPHVAGRFLVRRHEFKGLQDASDVAYVLNRYDEVTEWPRGSEISYTAHFAGEAFRDHGFRLSHYATRLWELASNLRAQERLPSPWTWAMKSFEAMVVHLLTIAIPRAGPSFELLTDQQLLDALRVSGLLELEKSRHTYRPMED